MKEPVRSHLTAKEVSMNIQSKEKKKDRYKGYGKIVFK